MHSFLLLLASNVGIENASYVIDVMTNWQCGMEISALSQVPAETTIGTNIFLIPIHGPFRVFENEETTDQLSHQGHLANAGTLLLLEHVGCLPAPP